MLRLGAIKDNDELKTKWAIEENLEKLREYPKPIALEGISSDALGNVLQVLNGEGYFHAEECGEAKATLGSGGGEVAHYCLLLGEIEETLERKSEQFSFFQVKPKTSIAIIVQSHLIHDYYSGRFAQKGKVYFLKKPSVGEPAS
jgi:hypothetical protein